MSDHDDHSHSAQPSAAEASRLLAQRLAGAEVVAHGSVPSRSGGEKPRRRRLVLRLALAAVAVALVVALAAVAVLVA